MNIDLDEVKLCMEILETFLYDDHEIKESEAKRMYTLLENILEEAENE